MKVLTNIFALTIIFTLFTATTFANNTGDKNKTKVTPEVTTKAHKALKGVMVFDKMPVLDKDICNLELDFDIVVNGTDVEFINKSIGEYSHVEIMYGDGTIAKSFEEKYTYANEGVHYVAVSLYNESTGCMDFVGANVFIGKQADGSNETIIKASDLNADNVANLAK